MPRHGRIALALVAPAVGEYRFAGPGKRCASVAIRKQHLMISPPLVVAGPATNGVPCRAAHAFASWLQSSAVHADPQLLVWTEPHESPHDAISTACGIRRNAPPFPGPCRARSFPAYAPGLRDVRPVPLSDLRSHQAWSFPGFGATRPQKRGLARLRYQQLDAGAHRSPQTLNFPRI